MKGGDFMKRVYACLLGNWIDITNEGLLHNRNPLTYINEEIQDMFEYDYIKKGRNNI